MLERICWASLGRAEISPNLSLGETMSCPDLLGTPLPIRPSVSAETAWFGQVGEWDLEEKLEFSFLLELLRKSHVVSCGQAVTAAHHPPALVFGEEEREAELLGWPDLVLTGTSTEFPWLSGWRHHCKVFLGQHLQESKNWKGSQLLWGWVAGCFSKCSHPCGLSPQHPFSVAQAELQEKQLVWVFSHSPYGFISNASGNLAVPFLVEGRQDAKGRRKDGSPFFVY